MKFWIVGTDTDIGKTTVSAWICLHTGYSYWKPIQTGYNVTLEYSNTDSKTVKKFSNTTIYPELHILKEPLAPYFAAQLENTVISFSKEKIPACKNLLIEAAGGLLVPLNEEKLYIDIIKDSKLPVILVTRSSLGTINHTCLSIEALRTRNIKLLGVIISGQTNTANAHAIEKYGKTEILAQLNKMETVSKANLYNERLPQKLINILR